MSLCVGFIVTSPSGVVDGEPASRYQASVAVMNLLTSDLHIKTKFKLESQTSVYITH